MLVKNPHPSKISRPVSGMKNTALLLRAFSFVATSGEQSILAKANKCWNKYIICKSEFVFRLGRIVKFIYCVKV